MMNVLVTGAQGFLGRYIVEKLAARGDSVRAFIRRDDANLSQLGVEIFRGDLRDESRVVAACQGQQAVIHTAAIAGIWGPWETYYAINTLGTRHVLEGCRRAGVERLVYCSSPSVTFDGRAQCGVPEDAAPYPARWLCHYPHTKALAEQAVLAANDGRSLLTCALRPHLIWGPRDPHLVPRLLERARRGALRRVGDGQNLIDVIYVENAADAHLQALDQLQPNSVVCGRAYFLSQGKPVNCWQWIDELLQMAGLPRVTKSIGLASAWHLGHLLERVSRVLGREEEPRMTRFLAAQLGLSHYFDISRARADFGYVPRISLAEGMQRLANSWANG